MRIGLLPALPIVAALFGAVVPAAPAVAGPPAVASGADEDLRQAARLHKAGETSRATAIWNAWAERGHVDAAYNLAVVHQHGDGVPRDMATALKWYRVAAEREDKVSQYALGLAYLNGDGVARDEKEAHRWFVMGRAHHAHHGHDEQMQRWRRQALGLIEERDRREAVAAARDADAVLAELRRRAGLPAPASLAAAQTQIQR
ncbi:MAG: sel1 repeat family protein [Rhodocyclaceae bacterium]|nr:sel1 repeat family protein [Rhodocyclaceae bacterium]